jgi:hypothetical protein
MASVWAVLLVSCGAVALPLLRDTWMQELELFSTLMYNIVYLLKALSNKAEYTPHPRSEYYGVRIALLLIYPLSQIVDVPVILPLSNSFHGLQGYGVNQSYLGIRRTAPSPREHHHVSMSSSKMGPGFSLPRSSHCSHAHTGPSLWPHSA